jgi:hypothetical protein
MAKDSPDFRDAELAMKVYDLRREAVMRESRSAINARFWPKSYEDLASIMTPDNPLNAPFRQVSTYWEMVYGMVKWGIVHPGYFLESNGEGLFLYAKVAPYVERYREDYAATAFRSAEWVATECPEGRRLFEIIAARVRKIAASR